ncbi:MAG TPA: spore germination protein [Firmicutes bacterium]|nr:spore germination protein [Bacillota bacterium]
MRWPWSKPKETEPPTQLTSPPLQDDLEVNIQTLQLIFGNSTDLIVRRLNIREPSIQAATLYFQTLVDMPELAQRVLEPILAGLPRTDTSGADPKTTLQAMEDALITAGEVKRVANTADAVDALLQECALVFVAGVAGALAIRLPRRDGRQVEEPDIELVLSGPRDGFVEDLATNLSLIHSRLRTDKLRIETTKVGKYTQTKLVLIYLDGLVNPNIIVEARKRISRVNVDGVLSVEHIEELLEDAPYSLFPTMGSTRRPDTCVAQLIEGSFAVICDGSPVALFAPVTFFTFFQSPDDYYTRYPGVTWLRWLRLFGLLISTTAPAFWVALVNFHPELIPFNLFVTVAQAREVVPFPLVFEILMMDITFELLREAQIRMPRPIGQAMSILGALVLGQVVIQSGLVGSHALLVVAITAITSFMVGRIKITQATRILRFAVIISASIMGFLGLVLTLIAIITHQVSLRSYGVPYMYPLAPRNWQAMKDVLIRAPRWAYTNVSSAYIWDERRRQISPKPSPELQE